MKTVMMLCFANIRKKKLQNLSVMILMLLSTILIATATAIILNAGDNFTKLHSKTNGSHQIMILDQGYHDPHKVYQWWANQQGVTSSNLLPFKTITEISYKNEKIQNRFLYMISLL
jgi:putative ABC transport system permease protein